MALVEEFLDIFGRSTIGAIFVEMVCCLGPVWIAFFVGIVVGWTWKPKWATLGNCKFDFSMPSSPTALVLSPSNSSENEHFASSPQYDSAKSRPLQQNKFENLTVTDEDFEHLFQLVEKKDGGPPWKHMMDRSAPHMSYQAWQRDPETGPPQYCSRTVYEDATPELLRDFFWDDEFRLKWDDMIVNAETIEECPTTGTMVVHWVRKFPFFCSDREYIIGRRIWDSGRSYYCVTKGVPCPSIPRKDKPRRVDLYYSSWYIGEVESSKGNSQPTACEVILFHHEDMGIPWEIAKFGVKQGMWGAVRKIERGFRAYQKAKAFGLKISHCAFMARVNTKIDREYLKSMEDDEESSETELQASPAKPEGMNIPKLLIVGGAVAVACTLNQGILPKVLLFNAVKRFGNIGRRACPRT